MAETELDVRLFEGHTPGPWEWASNGRSVGLHTPDRGRLVVMDLVRDGMQGAKPRFAHWSGMENGEPRNRRGGILEDGTDHPDARLIAAAPALLAEVIRLRAVVANRTETADA